MEQGKIAGKNMAGEPVEYRGSAMPTTLKVAGIDLASAGEIDADNAYEAIVESTEQTYKKLVIDNNRIIGCILLGDSSQFRSITKMMEEERDVSDIKEEILKPSS
jgi:nitrite reductase (NADH) large subunit